MTFDLSRPLTAVLFLSEVVLAIVGWVYTAVSEKAMGQWDLGRGSNGSPTVNGSHGSWVRES